MIAPMQAGNIFLGRSWQYDREFFHNGHTNQYSLRLNNHKFILAPLDQKKVRDMQPKARVSATTRVSFHVYKFYYLCQNADMISFSLPKESFSGFGTTKNQVATPKAATLMKSHTPTLKLHDARGVYHSILIGTMPFEAPSNPELKQYQGKVLNSQNRMKANILSFVVDIAVSRTKTLEEGGYDVRTRTKPNEKLSLPSIHTLSDKILGSIKTLE